MDLHAKRTQWPVGQGCFASGTITAADKSFVYVYDCGSENQGALRQAICNLKPPGDLIDALFLSHLDSDHVNGVDYLCSACEYKVDTVYLPYLSMIDCLLVLGNALADDSFSWSLGELVVDPQEWFGRRGVSRLIMVHRRDIDDEEGPTLPEDLFPNISPDEKHTIKDALESKGRLGIFELPKLDKTKATRDGLATLSTASSKVIFFLSNLSDAPAWILVPFVPPLPSYAVESFKKKVQDDLGIVLGEQAIKSRKGVGQLMDILRDGAARKKLKEAYKTLARDHNSVSMCLYSGPLASNPDKIYWDVMNPPLDYVYYNRRNTARKYGWIGTGDLTLNLDHHLSAFKNHYGRFSDKIAALLLPHHGSHYNFSHDLGHFCSPEITLAAAGLKNRWDHPHTVVLATMRLLGSQVFPVTEEPTSTVVEELLIER